jgi:hypothetical protein
VTEENEETEMQTRQAKWQDFNKSRQKESVKLSSHHVVHVANGSQLSVVLTAEQMRKYINLYFIEKSRQMN